jgi:methionyl-tRNA synthetase
MSFKSYYISTTIPYVNSQPHVGHAQEFILADALTRHYRQQKKEVFFQSGTDDNATKNVLAANLAGIATQEFVDQNASKFNELLLAANAYTNKFVRTSSAEHFQSVRFFLSQLKLHDIYQSAYQGLYCSGCEDYLLERDLIEGLCPDHRKAPELIQEQNIFFRLSRYQDVIAKKIESGKIRITPATRKAEILAFIRSGLTDISLTRSSARTADWGISYPGATDQTVYVWIDALVNYLSGLGYGRSSDWKEYWSEEVYKIHIIGKNVWKFHAVYWPALLLSAGLPLPNEIIIHGFLTNDGVKISKSLNNGADPLELIKKYGSDALRGYLLGSLSVLRDTDFSEVKLTEFYNSELANKFGNLASRLISLAKRADLKSEPISIDISTNFFERYESGFKEINKLNAEINDQKPWLLLKEKSPVELCICLERWLAKLNLIAKLLEPILPNACQKLQDAIKNYPEDGFALYPRIK